MSINQDIVIRTNASQSISELEKLGRANTNALNSYGKGMPQLKDFSKQADVTDVKLKGVTASTLALASAYGQLLNVQKMMADVFGGAYKYSTMMENNAIGISAILKSMVKVNGATMQWNESMAMSKNLMSKLRVEALQTASTSQDLIETFRGILGPALSQGMTIDQTMEFSKIGVNAVRSLGLPPNQYLQELRSILQGNIRPSSSTLATALGITNQDVKNAKNNAGGVYKFLMDRMAGFERATSETSKTVTGRLAILEEGLYATIEKAGKGVYRDYSNWLKEISDRMFTLDDITGKIELNPNFVAGTKEILEDFRKFSGVVGNVVLSLTDNASGIAKSLEMFALFKGGQWVTNSGLNFLESFVDKFVKVETFLVGNNTEMKLQAEYERLCLVVEKSKELVESNQEYDELLNNISGGVKKLAEYYTSLGVESEKAAQWQKQIEGYIIGGVSYEEIEKTKRLFEQQAQNIKNKKEEEILAKKIARHTEKIAEIEAKRDRSLKAINEDSARGNAKYLQAFYKAIEEANNKIKALRENLAKEMDKLYTDTNAIANKELSDIVKGGNRYAGGERTVNSITRLEERLVALGMEREQAQLRVARINDLILSMDKEDLEVMRDEVNFAVVSAEMDAQELGAMREKEALQNKELRNLDSRIAKLTEAKKIERGLKREENKVNDFLSGKAVHTTTDKETGEKTTSKWDAKYIETARQMKNVLEEQNVPLEKRNNYISHYINLLSKNKTVEARIYAESVLESSKAYGEKIKEIQASERYASQIERLQLKVNQYGEAREQAELKEKTLMIDALNNVKALEQANEQMAQRIMNAWTLLNDEKQVFFNNEENRTKTLIALMKELSAGNMSVAESMAMGIEGAIKTNAGRNVDAEIQNVLAEKEAQLDKLRAEDKERRNKLIQEEIDLVKKSAAEIRKETESIDSLNASKRVSKTVTEEIIKLSAKEINEQQRAILMYEFKRNAVVGGDQKIVAETDKVIKSVEKEIEAMKKAGREGSVAYKTLIEIMKSVAQGTLKVDEALLKQMNYFVELEQKAKNTSNELQHNYLSTIGSVASAVGGLGMAYQMCTDDADSNLGKLAEWAINGSVVIGACESMVTAVGGLRKAYDELSKSILITKALQAGGTVLSMLGGLPGVMLALGMGATIWASEQDPNAIHKKFADKVEQNRLRNGLAQKNHPLHDVMEKYKDANFYTDNDPRNNIEDFPIDVNPKDIDLINTSDDTDKTKGANQIETLKKQAESAKIAYDELIQSVKVANAGKDESLTEFDKKREELAKKIFGWEKKSSELLGKGGAYSTISDKQKEELKSLIEDYKKLEKAEIERNETIKGYANELQNVNNLETNGVLTKRQADAQRVDVLQREIAFYKLLASEEQISLDKRLEYETIIAEKRKALRDAEMSDTKIQWDSVLEHIRNTSFNLTETFNSGIDGMIGRFTEFGQNIIGSTKSVTSELKDLCKNLTSDILNMMMKIYMQGLMMNLIGNIFGGGGVTNSIKTSKSMLSPLSTNSVSNIKLGGITPFANGGVARGWSIVGEKGPELVNFSNPGRVYTADQTRNALGGGGVNIKIDLHNESGTQVEAQTTGSTFDGENYVVGVVLKAISTNKNGMRNIIKGVATT